MIKQFRDHTPVNIFLLVVVAVALRLGMFVQLPDKLEFDFVEPFMRFLLYVPSESRLLPVVNVSLALVFTVVQAVLINKVVNDYNLLSKPSFLPALMYVTASSILMPFLVLSPTLICNFLIIWMIAKFLSIYKRHDASSAMYDMGMMVAIGTLIYFPFISMFFLLFVSLLILRPFNWREWVIGFVGFATIYFFIAVFYYWNDSFDKFYQIWMPLTNPFPSNIRISLYDFIVLIPLIIILGLSALAIQQNFFRSFVQVRKAFQLLFFLFVLSLASFYLKPQIRIYHFMLAVPAASIFMAYYFLNAIKKWIYESLYFLLVGFIIYFQFA